MDWVDRDMVKIQRQTGRCMDRQFYDLVPPRTPSRTLVAGAVKRKESTDLSIFKFKLHVLQWHSHYDKTLKRKKDVSIKILEISWQSVV